MAKKQQNVDNPISIDFPVRGLDVENPFDLQPPYTTVDAVNVRAFEPGKMRARGGSRPGLARYLPALPTGAVIQHLDFIVDPQADALTADFDDAINPLYPYIVYMDDPSTNNLKIRNPGAPGTPRRVRRGGSGRQSNININRSPVTITWSNPADIMVGTALSSVQLNAIATSGILAVAGTFVYSPTAGAVLPLGDGQALSTVFTPTDTGIYRKANKTVFINVVSNKIVTHVVPTGPTAFFASSQTLSERGVSAVGKGPTGGTVPGAMVYDPALSTVPTAPSITITYTFTPTDTASYYGSNLTVTYPVSTEPELGNGTGDCTEGNPGGTPEEIDAWIAAGRPASFTNVELLVDEVLTPHDDLIDILAGDGSANVSAGNTGITIFVSYAEGSTTPVFTYQKSGGS